MKFNLTLLFYFATSILLAQNNINFERDFSDTIPERLKIESSKIKNYCFWR